MLFYLGWTAEFYLVYSARQNLGFLTPEATTASVKPFYGEQEPRLAGEMGSLQSGNGAKCGLQSVQFILSNSKEMRMKALRLVFFTVTILAVTFVLVSEFRTIFIRDRRSSTMLPAWAYGSLSNNSAKTSTYDKIQDEESAFGLSNRFELYVRLTSKDSFRQQLDGWLFKSINLFFVKYLASTVVVLDTEKSEDLEFGNEIIKKKYAHMKLRLCFMNPLPQNTIHHWGKERMYLDMMHADFCTQREFVGFLNVDTLFVTAVTEDLLFEHGKPVVTARIGVPRVPCWLDTAEYILGRKQVMQCMSYFPVVFKVSHIVEMRKYVEKIHNKTFLKVFKTAPEAVKVATTCFCHYSIMCNSPFTL